MTKIALIDAVFCNSCKENKDRSEFYKAADRKTGVTTYCKVCFTAYQRKLYKKLPADKLLIKNRKANLKRVFNLSIEDKERMLLEQGNKCQICGTAVDMMSHIDHCHSTGMIRGILCMSCNVGLGHFKHNRILLQNARLYLDV